jgi:hypothetical protein
METSKPILLTNEGREPAAKGPMQALVAEGMHYIRSADGLEELYHLKSDPEERFNLAGASMNRDVLQRFRASLDAVVRTRELRSRDRTPPSPPLSKAVRAGPSRPGRAVVHRQG